MLSAKLFGRAFLSLLPSPLTLLVAPAFRTNSKMLSVYANIWPQHSARLQKKQKKLPYLDIVKCLLSTIYSRKHAERIRGERHIFAVH